MQFSLSSQAAPQLPQLFTSFSRSAQPQLPSVTSADARAPRRARADDSESTAVAGRYARSIYSADVASRTGADVGCAAETAIAAVVCVAVHVCAAYPRATGVLFGCDTAPLVSLVDTVALTSTACASGLACLVSIGDAGVHSQLPQWSVSTLMSWHPSGQQKSVTSP